jgi:hypothetical protein
VTWGSALLAVALLVTGTTLWYRDRNGGVEAPLAQLETTPSQGRDSDDELSDYLRRHALESSRTPFVDYDDAVAFVDYREP